MPGCGSSFDENNVPLGQGGTSEGFETGTNLHGVR